MKFIKKYLFKLKIIFTVDTWLERHFATLKFKRSVTMQIACNNLN